MQLRAFHRMLVEMWDATRGLGVRGGADNRYGRGRGGPVGRVACETRLDLPAVAAPDETS